MNGTAIARAAAFVLLAGWSGGCATDANDAHFRNASSRANIYVSPTHADVRKVAILPFKAPTELIGAGVSDFFLPEMQRVGQYEIVERSQMAALLGETELSLSGLSSADAAKAGSIVGADGVIMGTVSEYEKTAQGGRTYAVAGISARLVHCATGKILWSVDLAERAESSSVSLSEHARHVVHEMVSTLYRQLRNPR